jgi:hypothetical protein
VLAFRPDGADLPERFRDETYRFYSAAQLQAMASSAGFAAARIVSAPQQAQSVAWLIAEREA